MPSQYEVTQSAFRGYDRGHIVASADRLYSKEANEQTFYYTNMSPQRHNLNTGVWLQLEKLVQEWARSGRLRDKLYVVKGGAPSERARPSASPWVASPCHATTGWLS